jgi:hypothetical protein
MLDRSSAPVVQDRLSYVDTDLAIAPDPLLNELKGSLPPSRTDELSNDEIRELLESQANRMQPSTKQYLERVLAIKN